MFKQLYTEWLRLMIILYFIVGLTFVLPDSVFSEENRDVPTNFSFRLVKDGQVLGNFAYASGMGSATEVIELVVIDPNGQPVIEKAAGINTLNKITLKRGITNNLSLWQWRQQVIEGNIDDARANISIVLIEPRYQMAIAQWDCTNGWPNNIRYDGSIDSSPNAIIEALTIVFDESSLNTNIDQCPDDPNKTQPGVCGCGHSDIDTDHDGISDCKDGCPEDPNKNIPGICGCGISDDDSDADGWVDCNDNCPNVPNPDQFDTNNNGIGDVCDNSPPTANAGPNQSVETGSDCIASVTLNGADSYDPDGDTLTYLWSWDSESISGVNPTIQLPLGIHTITLIVNDGTVDSDPDTVDFTIEDTTTPVAEISFPSANYALQDGVAFMATASDTCGVNEVYFYLRESNGGNGIPIGYEDLPGSLNTSDLWEYSFDTTLLPDGYYLILAKAIDGNGNEGWSEPVPVSIRNWAVIQLLPASKTYRSGRTMPVKFSLRISAAVDPAKPFVYNQELEIRIYDASAPGAPLQVSLYGETSTDFRINTDTELYITNFKTSKTPTEYSVEIWRASKNFMIDSFSFVTSKK